MPWNVEQGGETVNELFEVDSESDEKIEFMYRPREHLQQPRVVELRRGSRPRKIPDFYGEPVPTDLI